MFAWLSMQTVNTQYCLLQGSVASRDVNSCESRLAIKVRSGRGSTFMHFIVRCNILSVITMVIHGFLTLFYALRCGNPVWLMEAEIDGVILGHRRKLTAISLKGNPFPVLNFCTFFMLVIFAVVLVVSAELLVDTLVLLVDSLVNCLCSGSHTAYNPSHNYLCSSIMVRSGKRKRSGGHRDTRLHPPVGFALETAAEPLSPSPAQEVGPSASSGRKPRRNSAFQTTQFKFQSNLHRSLVTAHITLILSEEENLVTPLTCIAPEPSPGSDNSSESDSKDNWVKEKDEQEALLRNLPPLDDTVPVVGDKIHGDAEQAITIPDSDLSGNEGHKDGDTARDEKKINDPAQEK